MEPLESRQLLTVYYVSPSGSDANPGTKRAPWQTLDRVSHHHFQGGDRILLEGGHTFNGTLYLGPDDKGSRAAPVAISSYGVGRARINGVQDNGILIYNTGGVEISDINCSGPLGKGRGKGIMLFTDTPGHVKYDYVRIDQIAAIRHHVGIEMGSTTGSGFRDVWITNSDVYNNVRGGLITYAAERNVHEKVLVRRVHSFNNTGIAFPKGTRPTQGSGQGILLGMVNAATVEYSVAHHNGELGDAGAGIWTYNSNKVLFQFNESYSNKTAGDRDGDGFDFDQNVSNSVMQYNYSHDNDGAGYLMASHIDNALHTNTVVRYNISQNDNRKMEYGALHIFGRITNSQWYNNTVYQTANPSDRKNGYGIQVRNGGITNQDVKNVHFRNNSIYVTSGVKLVRVTAEQLEGGTDLRFEGNNYYASDKAFKFEWGDSDYSTFSSWRSGTGQERVNGQNVGSNANPRHVEPTGGPTIGDADLLATVTAYRLQNDSPIINRGLNLAKLFNTNTGGRDFLGNPVPADSSDIGAFEFV